MLLWAVEKWLAQNFRDGIPSEDLKIVVFVTLGSAQRVARG